MKKKKRVSYAKYGYLFSLPFVLAFLLCMLYPIICTFIFGFTDLKTNINGEWHFIAGSDGGLWKNYKDLFSNELFRTSFLNTVKIWIVNFIPQILLALLLSAWFTNNSLKIKGKGFFKVVFYMPNIITAATIAYLFRSMFTYSTASMGPINQFIGLFGADPVDWTNTPPYPQIIVAFIQFWQWYGNTMIVLISGILGISPELYEAASIDGATGTQQFFKITIPNLKTILLYTLVTSMVGGIQMFDIPLSFLNGMPDNTTYTASMFIYKQAFQGMKRYNLASAASMVMFVVIAFFSCILFFVMRDKDAAMIRKINKKAEKEFKRKMKEEGGMSA